MNGIIVVNKPKNYTSFDIVAILRKKLKQKKIGHMGTLDPIATGVLPVLLGSTAKFQIFAPENEKEYLAEIKFGVITDTWDIFGKIVSEKHAQVEKSDLENILPKFTGEIDQIPPMYSAIKIGGIKLYSLARKGKEIERKPRHINIKLLELVDFNKKDQTAKIKVKCSKGTYIRSLCFDIGTALGCGASMGNLQRTMSNSFTLSDCITLQKIKDLEIEEIKSRYVRPTDYLFRNNNYIYLNDDESKAFRNGVNLRLPNLKSLKDEEIIKLYTNNKFLGLGKVDCKNHVIKFLKCESKE